MAQGFFFDSLGYTHKKGFWMLVMSKPIILEWLVRKERAAGLGW
jgi:hypothetical protein